MGIGLNLALFIGIPAAVIVGLGFILSTFRDPIVSSARASGEVFSSIFTGPVQGFVEGISGAFSDLPDIKLRVPGIDLSFGESNLQNPFENIFPEIPPGADIDVLPLGPNESITDRVFNPPTPTPTPQIEVPGLTVLPGELTITTPTGIQRQSRADIVQQNPGVLALIDFLSTERVEFLPVGEEALRFFEQADSDIRISGQIFQERPGANILFGGA